LVKRWLEGCEFGCQREVGEVSPCWSGRLKESCDGEGQCVAGVLIAKEQTMRFGRVFFIIVILACIFETWRLWGITPAQMAAHFNLQGNPDRFVPKAEFFWYQIQTLMTVIGVSLLPQVLFLFLPADWINMPNREYWLAPERRDETVDRLSSFGAMMFGIILLVIQAGFELAVSANLRTPIFFNARLMIPIMVASFVLIGLMLFWLVISFRRPSPND
jgi:uncharacterized membrane protein